jgi:hypothetical protein
MIRKKPDFGLEIANQIGPAGSGPVPLARCEDDAAITAGWR